MISRIKFFVVIRILAYFSSIVFLLCLIIIANGLNSESSVAQSSKLTVENITQARKILYEGTKTKPDNLAAITLTEADLNLAANYLLNRYFQSAIRIELVNQKVRCNVALKLPKNTIVNYFNVSFRLSSENDQALPHIAKFKVGKLLLPAKFAGFVLDLAIRYSFLNEYFILATSPIQRVGISNTAVTIFYEKNSPNRLTNLESREIYQQKIAEIIAQHHSKIRLSLAELLKPVFELALQRSTAENAIEENRSAIFSLNDYVNSIEDPQLKPFLYKRTDLAQHFTGSAALTASMNRHVADALGEVKELSDAQTGGSGFSFVDLAADKAGSRFGELAVLSSESALRIQKLTSKIHDYRDFMPDPRDLPEHMSETDFKKLFESTQSPAYLRLANLIDRRIAEIALYQTP